MNFKYYKVTSVQSYLKKLSIIKKTNELFPTSFLYRGESKCFDAIKPALYRDSNMHNNEYPLQNKAQLEFPEMFDDCHCLLERIIKMQHFGLPTRLLDVTQNPLIALYFACESNKNENGCEFDGRVLLINQPLISLDLIKIYAEIIECINKSNDNVYSIEMLVQYLYSKNILTLNPLCNKSKDEQIQYNKELLFNDIVKPFLFVPAYTNPRIKNQKGAFLLGPILKNLYSKQSSKVSKNDLKKKATIDSALFEKSNDNYDDFFYGNTLAISGDCKQAILRELEEYGITEAFVYPDYEHQMKYVKDSISRKNSEWDLDVNIK